MFLSFASLDDGRDPDLVERVWGKMIVVDVHRDVLLLAEDVRDGVLS